jgi:choloylglycine hydrolase
MCTDFLLLAADNSVVIGRSMEFGQNLDSQIVVGGRGTKKASGTPTLPTGTDWLNWTAKYGYIGLNAGALGPPTLIADGMNEKGLSIGALWLPGFTQYSLSVSDDAQALDVKLFAGWVLGNFATVAEVETGLTGVLTNSPPPGLAIDQHLQLCRPLVARCRADHDWRHLLPSSRSGKRHARGAR